MATIPRVDARLPRRVVRLARDEILRFVRSTRPRRSADEVEAHMAWLDREVSSPSATSRRSAATATGCDGARGRSSPPEARPAVAGLWRTFGWFMAILAAGGLRRGALLRRTASAEIGIGRPQPAHNHAERPPLARAPPFISAWKERPERRCPRSGGHKGHSAGAVQAPCGSRWTGGAARARGERSSRAKACSGSVCAPTGRRSSTPAQTQTWTRRRWGTGRRWGVCPCSTCAGPRRAGRVYPRRVL